MLVLLLSLPSSHEHPKRSIMKQGTYWDKGSSPDSKYTACCSVMLCPRSPSSFLFHRSVLRVPCSCLSALGNWSRLLSRFWLSTNMVVHAMFYDGWRASRYRGSIWPDQDGNEKETCACHIVRPPSNSGLSKVLVVQVAQCVV